MTFTVEDGNGNRITGLVDVNFTKSLEYNGSASGVGKAVNEWTGGRYSLDFTPNAEGPWAATISHVTYGTWDGQMTCNNREQDIDNILADTAEMQGKLPTNNIMGSSVKTDLDDEIAAIKGKTDNLPTDTASELTSIKTETDKIPTVLTDTDEIQGKLPTDNIMGSAVLTSKDDEIDVIKGKTDNLPTNTATELTNILNDTNEIQGKLPTNNIMGSSSKDDLDDEIIAIKAKTDTLPTDTGTTLSEILADTNEIQGKLPTNNIMGSSVKTDKDDEIDAIKNRTDNLPVNTSTQLTSIETETDKIPTVLADTDEIQTKLPTDYIMGSN